MLEQEPRDMINGHYERKLAYSIIFIPKNKLRIGLFRRGYSKPNSFLYTLVIRVENAP